MTKETVQSEWNDREVDLDREFESIVDQYPDYITALIQESIQNAKDAYSGGTPNEQKKIVIRYDTTTRTYTIRDFGSGMSPCNCDWGKINGQSCKKCPWGAWHNQSFTTKAGKTGQSGYRGKGKAPIWLGEESITRTQLEDGRKQHSVTSRKAKWKWKLKEEAPRDIGSPGTEISIIGIRDNELHKQLSNAEIVRQTIAKMWSPLLDAGVKIRLMIGPTGNYTKFDVNKLSMPALDTSKGAEAKEQLVSKIVVRNKKNERLGELRNLKLFISKNELTEDDPKFGIAIIRNDQIIKQISPADYGDEIPANIRKRIFGQVEAICTDDEPFLQEAENPSHTDYKSSSEVYQASRLEIKKCIRKFAEPWYNKPQMTQKMARDLQKLSETLSKTIKDVAPEFLDIFDKSPGIDGNRGSSDEQLGHFCQIIGDSPQTMHRLGEHLPFDIFVRNPSDKGKAFYIKITCQDPIGTTYREEETDVFTVNANTSKKHSITIDIKKTFIPGIHSIVVDVYTPKGEIAITPEGTQIRCRRRFWVEEEPPEIKRPKMKSGGGSIGIDYMKDAGPDAPEYYFDESLMKVFVNQNAERFVYYDEKSVRQLYSAECFVSAWSDQFRDFKLKQKDNWNRDELKALENEITIKRRQILDKHIQSLTEE